MKQHEKQTMSGGMEVPLVWVKYKCQRCVDICSLFVAQHKVDIITCATDILVNQPFLVLRWQCQVQADCNSYHLSPVTLVPVAVTLVQRKGLSVLYRGMISVFILRAVQLSVEHIMSRYTGWATRLPPTWYINKEWLSHYLLKFSSLIIMAPMYSMSLIYTVSVPGETRKNYLLFQKCYFPLPFWQKLLPTVVYGMLKYTFSQATLSLSSAILYLNLCFDKTERDACQRAEEGIDLENKENVFLKAAVISYLSAEFVFYPLETIVNRLILQGARKFTNDLDCGTTVVEIVSNYGGFFDCCDKIIWLEGKQGLYKGFGALVMQAICYYYCTKFVSFIWHYIRMYKEAFMQNPSKPNVKMLQ